MREIEAFLAVADELHFGRAAQRLHVTTASISQAIRALERKIGAPLFERTSRRVKLTAVGAEFLARVRPAHDALTGALTEARRAGRLPYRDLVRVGFANTLPSDLAPRSIKAFGHAAADGQLVRIDHQSSHLLSWFETGQFEADVCVGWSPDVTAIPRPAPDWIEIGPVLFRDQRAALMSKAHPLAGRAGRAAIDADELADHDVLRPWGYGPYAEGWYPPTTPSGKPARAIKQTRITYFEDLPQLLGGGTLIHLTTTSVAQRLAADSDFTGVPVTGLKPLDCAIFWARDTENPLIRVFAAAAAAEYMQ